ncbi:MAG TPA: LLM class flavin-dependent oxidoreductase, partial [Solirubrobacteraceae bacterium]
TPGALRRAARVANGFFGAGSQPTAAYVDQVRTLKEALAEAGRSDFQIAKRVYIAVDDDEDRARRRMTEALERMYGYFGMRVLEAAVFGSAQTCIDRLGEVKEAGAEMILLNPLFDDLEQMERLAAEVVPSL